jgi:hypothetical protein
MFRIFYSLLSLGVMTSAALAGQGIGVDPAFGQQTQAKQVTHRFQARVPVDRLQAYDMAGKPVDGQSVDKSFLKIVRPEAIIIVAPIPTPPAPPAPAFGEAPVPVGASA